MGEAFGGVRFEFVFIYIYIFTVSVKPYFKTTWAIYSVACVRHAAQGLRKGIPVPGNPTATVDRAGSGPPLACTECPGPFPFVLKCV